MAINFTPTPRGVQPTLIFGIGSHLKFAEQTVSGTAKTAANDFSKYKVAVNSMEVAPTTQLLTPGTIPITVDQFKGVPGPLSVAGNFVIDALPKRQELFFRQLLNANLADITDEAATGQAILTNQTLATATVSTVTNPTNPEVIIVTLSSGAQRGGADLSGANQIVITINGTTTTGGSGDSEILRFSSVGHQTTSKTFSTIDSITTNHAATPPAAVLSGTFNVTAGGALNGVKIKSNTNFRITPGLTVEAVWGSNPRSVPNTIIDAYINTLALSATRENILTYNFGLTGKRFNQNVNPLGAEAEFSDSSRAAGTLYGAGAFATIQDGQTPYAGYQVCLYADVNGTKAKFDGALGLSMNFDNNTQFTPRLCDIFQGLAYNRQRTITVDIELEYHKSDRALASAYLNATDWENVEYRITDANHRQTRFIFPKIQITEYPSMPVQDDDFVRQTIRGMALPSTNSAADAIEIHCLAGDTKTSLGLTDFPT